MNLGESLMVIGMILILVGAGIHVGNTIAKHDAYEKSVHETICKCEIKK
jgi:hypothetical protein